MESRQSKVRPTKRTLVTVAATLICVLAIGYFYRPRIEKEFTALPRADESGLNGGFALGPQAAPVTINLEPALDQRFGMSSIHLRNVEYEEGDIVVGYSHSNEFIGYDKRRKRMFLYSPDRFADAPPGLMKSDAIPKERALALVQQICTDFGIDNPIDAKGMQLLDMNMEDDLDGCYWSWITTHRIGNYDVLDRVVVVRLNAYDGSLIHFRDLPIGELPTEDGTPISQDEAVELVLKELRIASLDLSSATLGYHHGMSKSDNPWIGSQEPPELVWVLRFKDMRCVLHVEALSKRFVSNSCVEGW